MLGICTAVLHKIISKLLSLEVSYKYCVVSLLLISSLLFSPLCHRAVWQHFNGWPRQLEPCKTKLEFDFAERTNLFSKQIPKTQCNELRYRSCRTFWTDLWTSLQFICDTWKKVHMSRALTFPNGPQIATVDT